MLRIAGVNLSRLGGSSRRQLSTSLSLSPSNIDQANRQAAADSQSSVEIKRTPDGRGYGLFARDDIQEGQTTFRGRALEVHSHRTRHSIQTDWDRHVTMDLPAVLVNHSCEANLGIRPNSLGAYDFVALQDIPKDAELLWDYETAESEISDFQCSCGAPGCRGTLKGFHYHEKEIVEAYGEEHVAPYLLEEERQHTKTG